MKRFVSNSSSKASHCCRRRIFCGWRRSFCFIRWQGWGFCYRVQGILLSSYQVFSGVWYGLWEVCGFSGWARRFWRTLLSGPIVLWAVEGREVAWPKFFLWRIVFGWTERFGCSGRRGLRIILQWARRRVQEWSGSEALWRMCGIWVNWVCVWSLDLLKGKNSSVKYFFSGEGMQKKFIRC